VIEEVRCAGRGSPGRLNIYGPTRTADSKLDRRALPAPDYAAAGTFHAPATARERALRELFAAVLGIGQAGVDDTFFDLGGHSLLAAVLAARLVEQLSVKISLKTGGTLDDGRGAYFAPAVLTGVTPEMRAYREELFGPVAVVYKVSSDDEAVQLANAVDFGLGGAVFSADEQRAVRVAEQLEVGMANVNTPAGEGADLPFGGTKRSGFGRELGPLGIDEFVNKRLFYVEK
jgi:succinate-semialdehyde dehydrogenase/glutarate-semialdehyde dehydrogenase